MKVLLSIKNLSVSVGSAKIISGISLSVRPGELHVIMGPNGSGKSTLAYALMGHPHYRVRASALSFRGKPLLKLDPDERARLGMFLAFQYPLTIPGLSVSALLPETIRAERNGKKDSIKYPTLAAQEAIRASEERARLKERLTDALKQLKLDDDFLYRNLNDGFSGGEKKKVEILQMLALKPRLAILDEPDSGLDVDALRDIARAIQKAHREGMACILITHYQRILKYLKPDAVHVVQAGKIVASGGPELARAIERSGYRDLNRHAKTRTT